MRFGRSQVIASLVHRLSQLREKVSYVKYERFKCSDYKNCGFPYEHEHVNEQVTFGNLMVHVFFDRGVFNAVFTKESKYNNKSVYDALQELIDIYRNVHWLGE